jgi:ATP-dependent DNA ligase
VQHLPGFGLKNLVYAGWVDNGFDTAFAKDLRARLKRLIRKTQPYAKKIAHRGIWVEPSLLAEIKYRAKSVEGIRTQRSRSIARRRWRNPETKRDRNFV